MKRSRVRHAPRTGRAATTFAAVIALAAAMLAAPGAAWADTAPGAPVVSQTAHAPAGTTACPTSGSIPEGTVCSFTLSPNPADTAVPTEYQVSYPFNQGSPQDVTAADPGNGNTFDATTGVATISIVVDDSFGSLTVNSVDADGLSSPQTTQYIITPIPGSAGAKPEVFSDYNGDGTPDLLAAPAQSGDALGNGIWFAHGGPGGSVAAGAQNVLINPYVGTTATGGPFPWVGAEPLPGDWCGNGNTSLLIYMTPTPAAGYYANGGAFLFCGDGDANVVRNVANYYESNTYIGSGTFFDANSKPATELVDAGDLSGRQTGIPDLIAVMDNELVLMSATAPGAYNDDAGFGSGLCAYGDCAQLTDTPSPDGTFDWNAWKVLGYPTAGGKLDLYLWNPTTGELVLWTDVTATDAANDGTFANLTTLNYTKFVIASGTGRSVWNKGANLQLQVADFNRDGVPDLWAVDQADATVTAYTTVISGSSATVVAGAKQTLLTPAHQWALNDLASGNADQAMDSGSDTAITLRNNNTGTKWTTDHTVGAAVQFSGATGALLANANANALSAGSSFTVGAWVDPTAPGTVLSQEGTNDSSLFLSAAPGGTWRFGINTGATTSPTYAEGTAGLWRPGTWTHVVLTYNTADADLVLYVNGNRADTVHVSGAATVNGAFLIGANQAASALGSFFTGKIARVVTFDSALGDRQVQQLP